MKIHTKLTGKAPPRWIRGYRPVQGDIHRVRREDVRRERHDRYDMSRNGDNQWFVAIIFHLDFVHLWLNHHPLSI